MSLFVKFSKFIDRYILTSIIILIGLMLGIVHLFSKPRRPKVVKDILFIKVWAIGDTINFLPLIDSVKKRYPKATIWALAKDRNKAVFEAAGLVDRLILLERGYLAQILGLFRHFDIVIDGEPYLGVSALIALYLGRFRIGFAGQTRSMLYHMTSPFDRTRHVVSGYLDFAKLLGGKTQYKTLLTLDRIPDKDVRFVEAFIERNVLGRKTLIGFFMGAAESATQSRMWPKERFAKLADKLLSQYNDVVIVMPAADGDKRFVDGVRSMVKEKSRVFPVYGSLFSTFELIRRCKVFVSNDTGPMHIAAAQGVRTIGIFGPNTPVLWGPFGEKNISLYRPGVDCSPCIRNDLGLMPDCKRGMECIRKVSVEDVLNAVKKLLR